MFIGHKNLLFLYGEMGGLVMKSKYMKTCEITKEKYIGIKSYVFGKELYCYVDLVDNGEIKSKSRNKVYETGKGKYIEKGRKRHYIEERRKP